MDSLEVAFQAGFQKQSQPVAPIEEGKSDTAVFDERQEGLGNFMDTGPVSRDPVMDLSDQDFTTVMESLNNNSNDTGFINNIQNQLSGDTSVSSNE